MQQIFNESFIYPEQTDKNIQSKLLVKKELYDYRIKHIPDIKNYKDLRQYRDNKCRGTKGLLPQQIMLSHLINPSTPYTGLLIFHGLGTGKTLSAISIASGFISQIEEYNQKIYVLVPGPTLKQSWKNELAKFYRMSPNSKPPTVQKSPIGDQKKEIINRHEAIFVDHFRIMGYRSFYKKVLGDKIKETVMVGDQEKRVYQRDEKGEYLHIENYHKINSLDNSLLIVDEAHNLTGNNYIDAVREIIKKSVNLKVLLLTATPMKNFAEDVIELLNLLKSPEDQLKRTRIFSGLSFETEMAANGDEYFLENTRGIVSYVKGGDPYLFAKQKDYGEILPHMKYTKVIPCKMKKLQQQTYEDLDVDTNNGINQVLLEALNIVYPVLSETGEIIADRPSSKPGNSIKKLLNDKTHSEKYLQALAKYIGYPDSDNLEYLITVKGQTISGEILNEKYLHHFSTKFAKALESINDLVVGKKNPAPAFIYSNFVVYGINAFKQVLLANGYLEFVGSVEETTAKIQEDTRCYYCGKAYGVHKNAKDHTFYPACFISITGQAEVGEAEYGDTGTDNQEASRIIIDQVFNQPDNYQGKYIKFILGSKVLSEGYSLMNIREVHILDAWYNFTRIDQVVGRAIRLCSHITIASELVPYPEVGVYRYCIVNDNKKRLSVEELLYQKAEKKYQLIKHVEGLMQKNAIDCAINHSGNLNTPECIDPELKKFKNKEGDYIVKDKEIDLTTYDKSKMIDEVVRYEKMIKALFVIQPAYNIDEIISALKEMNTTSSDIDTYFVYKALDQFVLSDENEYADFTNFIVDKFNRLGYLIYSNGYYVFQEINTSEKTTVEDRITYPLTMNYNLTLRDYLQNTNQITESPEISREFAYDSSYYEDKKEWTYVGVVSQAKNKSEVFKIKQKKTGKQTSGSVCENSFTSEELKKMYQLICKELGLRKPSDIDNRVKICELIQTGLMKLERDSKNTKITYAVVPTNHPTFPFPYNTEDLISHITSEYALKKISINMTVKKSIDSVVISAKNTREIQEYPDPLMRTHFVYDENAKVWTLKY